MKKLICFMMIAGFMLAFSGIARAELVNVVDDSSSSSSTPNQDTSVVDLSDKNTDAPVQSPSFENTTPAGQAPGGPIESDSSNS